MERWFAALTPVHRTRGRVRFRYRCPRGTIVDARALEHAISGVAGVESVRVNVKARSLAVALDEQQTTADELAAALLALSPSARRVVGTPTHGGHGLRLSAVALSGVTALATRRIAPSLAAPIATAAAVPLLGEAIDDFLDKGITSHVLEAAAVAISIGRRDFLAANATSFLLALGEYLEDSIERRSDDLLKTLLKPGSREVWVERDGQEHEVDVDALVRGDVVIAGAGTVIAVDGTVLSGEATVNEATMTGESVPVTKTRGTRVLSGTVVEEGRLRIYAEEVGSNAAAARIAAFVEQSLAVRSRTQLAASRLADRLVPMVLGLAAVTGAATGDWQRISAVLQADYSCALKLATPVAFKSAMYRAGKSGMLIKGARALEQLARADTFVFDKTGTLTTGKLKVTDSIAFDAAYTSEDLICLAASVEEHYFHPLAIAVVEAARRIDPNHHFDHKAVDFVVAHGVASVIDGKRIVVGSRHFVEEDEGIAIDRHRAVIERLRREGKTLLYIGFGGELTGVLALKDAVRSNSAAMVARLRKLGVKKVLMLTGDHHDRAVELARELGLDGFHADLLPHDKAAVLQGLSEKGARIAFVGDGVNDAPALTGAHVGIAMQRGADIARLASDVVLLEDDIERVADARALALATRKLIDGNFKLTATINTSILAAAALGFLTPVTASMLHNGSTIGILLRALTGAGLRRAVVPPSRRPARPRAALLRPAAVSPQVP